jgi:hypothetical protein
MEITRTSPEARGETASGLSSPASGSSDVLGAAAGAITVGASVLLGALTLLVSSTGLVALLAAIVAHAGLLCIVLGGHLLLKQVDIASSIRRSYIVLVFTLFLCMAGTDFVIILRL